MLKKIFLLVAVVTFIALFGLRLLILSFGIWDYSHTDISCSEAHLPIGQAQLEGRLPLTMVVFEVKPFAVLTDRGYMYPGDEYEALGEAVWYGMATLISVGKEGATFLVMYPVDDPINGYSRQNCKAFIPTGEYR